MEDIANPFGKIACLRAGENHKRIVVHRNKEIEMLCKNITLFRIEGKKYRRNTPPHDSFP